MAAAAGPTRKYHVVMLGRTQFCVDTRFTNLRPIGKRAVSLISPQPAFRPSRAPARASTHPSKCARRQNVALYLCRPFPRHRRAWRLWSGRGGG